MKIRSLNVCKKQKEMKTKQPQKQNNNICCYNNNRRYYMLLLAIHLLSLYSTHTEVNMGMKEFLDSSEH